MVAQSLDEHAGRAHMRTGDQGKERLAHTRTLTDNIECTVCLDVMRTPKTLVCGHTFCGVCVDRLTSAGRAVRCPVCRKQMRVPAGGLSKNVLVEELIVERAKAKRDE